MGIVKKRQQIFHSFFTGDSAQNYTVKFVTNANPGRRLKKCRRHGFFGGFISTNPKAVCYNKNDMQYRRIGRPRRNQEGKVRKTMVRHLNPKIRTRFLEKAVPFNWALLQAVGILGLVVQCLNLARLLWGGAGLSTPASRTYCGFYLTMLALSVCFLGAKGLLNGRELETHYRVQQVLGVLFLTVEVAFGYYDIGQEASVGKIGTVTALVAFAALALMGPVYAVVSLTAAFGVMVGRVCTLGDPDAVFNYSLMGLVSLVVYLVRLRTIRTGLVRDQEIEQINRTLEETEEKFLLTSEQYELLLQRGRMIAFKWNIPSGTVRFSREWQEMFGETLRIEHIEDYIRSSRLLKPLQKEELFQCMENARRMNYQKKDLLLPVKTGEERWFEFQMATQCDNQGTPLLGVGLLFDIMDQKSRILQLQKELLMDNFTRTLNKMALESYAVRRLHEIGPAQRLGMLVLDMDDFKNINDTYGHLCGDAVLAQLAHLMNQLAPAGARVGRLGGDEFGAILDLADGEQQAREYAEALIQAVPGIRWEDKPMPAACSIGIAFCTEGVSYLELYAAADRALYRAKRQGKGRFCVAPLVEAHEESEPHHLPQSMVD